MHVVSFSILINKAVNFTIQSGIWLSNSESKSKPTSGVWMEIQFDNRIFNLKIWIVNRNGVVYILILVYKLKWRPERFEVLWSLDTNKEEHIKLFVVKNYKKGVTRLHSNRNCQKQNIYNCRYIKKSNVYADSKHINKKKQIFFNCM